MLGHVTHSFTRDVSLSPWSESKALNKLGTSGGLIRDGDSSVPGGSS